MHVNSTKEVSANVAKEASAADFKRKLDEERRKKISKVVAVTVGIGLATFVGLVICYLICIWLFVMHLIQLIYLFTNWIVSRIFGFYLPFRSDYAERGKEARQKLHALDGGRPVVHAPGSVRSNMNRALAPREKKLFDKLEEQDQQQQQQQEATEKKE